MCWSLQLFTRSTVVQYSVVCITHPPAHCGIYSALGFWRLNPHYHDRGLRGEPHVHTIGGLNVLCAGTHGVVPCGTLWYRKVLGSYLLRAHGARRFRKSFVLCYVLCSFFGMAFEQPPILRAASVQAVCTVYSTDKPTQKAGGRVGSGQRLNPPI